MAPTRARYFTTYHRYNDDVDEYLSKLRTTADWYVGQKETGKHGMQHIQLMFGFTNARSLSAVQKALNDLNVQVVTDALATYKYVTDENKRDEDGETYEYGEIPSFRKKMNDTIIEQALRTGSYEDAMRYIEDEDKLYFITHQKQLGQYFNSKFRDDDSADYRLEHFTTQHFKKELEDKVMVFIGDTGIGKTQFALAHFERPLLVRDKEDWSRYNQDTDGIVLDDINFADWNPLTFLKILNLDTPITQSVKYGHVRVKKGTKRIICCNSEDLLWPRGIHPETKNACLRRIEIKHFHFNLFPRQEKRPRAETPQTPEISQQDMAALAEELETSPMMSEGDELTHYIHELINSTPYRNSYSTEDIQEWPFRTSTRTLKPSLKDIISINNHALRRRWNGEDSDDSL